MKTVVPEKWIESGNLDPEAIKDSDDILYECGELLDDSCAYEIVGQVLFKAKDGKYYTVTVEAVIAEANPEVVKMVMEDHKDDNT